MPTDKDNLIKVKRTYVVTPQGRKYLSKLTNQEKEKILRKVRKDWKDLIRLHFRAEAGIRVDNAQLGWKELTPEYDEYKRAKGLLPGILEANTPTLMSRYQRSIRYNVNDFSIKIEYPELLEGKKRDKPTPVTAYVHQLGRIKRRIVKSGFTKIFRDRLLEFFNE